MLFLNSLLIKIIFASENKKQIPQKPIFKRTSGDLSQNWRLLAHDPVGIAKELEFLASKYNPWLGPFILRPEKKLPKKPSENLRFDHRFVDRKTLIQQN